MLTAIAVSLEIPFHTMAEDVAYASASLGASLMRVAVALAVESISAARGAVFVRNAVTDAVAYREALRTRSSALVTDATDEATASAALPYARAMSGAADESEVCEMLFSTR